MSVHASVDSSAIDIHDGAGAKAVVVVVSDDFDDHGWCIGQPSIAGSLPYRPIIDTGGHERCLYKVHAHTTFLNLVDRWVAPDKAVCLTCSVGVCALDTPVRADRFGQAKTRWVTATGDAFQILLILSLFYNVCCFIMFTPPHLGLSSQEWVSIISCPNTIGVACKYVLLVASLHPLPISRHW
jgi:hypothetical protein